jgi:hypothetical protein
MKKINLVKTLCSWCDAPAMWLITEAEWNDYACHGHGVEYFPETFAPEQYRVTSPGGYEQFYSDRTAAMDQYNAAPGSTLWRADGHGRWVKALRKAQPEDFPALRSVLRFD